MLDPAPFAFCLVSLLEKKLGNPIFVNFLVAFLFFLSNARWLSPGRLSSRKDNCIVQIHQINGNIGHNDNVKQKRTELDRYIIY